MNEQKFRELDTKVAVVTFDSGYLAKAYVAETLLTWPMLIDEDRSLYRAYSMYRAELSTLYNPASIGKYLQLMLKGQRLKRPGKDTRQLGGDVLIDPQGVVKMHFVSDSPHDRPTPESILKLIESN